MKVYYIRTSDGSYFGGRYNHFLEPVFEPRLTGAKLYEERSVAETVLQRMRMALNEYGLETHFPGLTVGELSLVNA